MADTYHEQLANALHDQIDAEEALQMKAEELVDLVRERFAAIVDSAGDFDNAFLAAAAMLEDELTDLTTEAVRQGAFLYLRRPDAKGIA